MGPLSQHPWVAIILFTASLGLVAWLGYLDHLDGAGGHPDPLVIIALVALGTAALGRVIRLFGNGNGDDKGEGKGE